MSISGRSGGSTLKLYRYDEFNRLVQYNDDGAEAVYTYGVDNLRASKTVNGTKTTYAWNGQNLAEETTHGATTVYAYDVTGVISSRADNDSVIRYIKDPHGNIVATSKNSTLFGMYNYTAFGNQLEATDTTNPFRYCGEYYDEESGLTYLRNRYYNSATGRFLTEDPIRDGLNWYVYCGGNPVTKIDPSGYLNDDDGERFGYDSPTYKMLEGLTDAYINANSDYVRSQVANLAATLRVTDTRITGAILLNNSAGAYGFGHNAVVLLNSSGQGFFFSFYPDDDKPIYDNGESRFSILNSAQVNELKEGYGEVYNAITASGYIRHEDGDNAYDRFVQISVTSEEGKAMFLQAADIFRYPDDYKLLGYQCDNVASQILDAGGHGYDTMIYPNMSYNYYKGGKTYGINETGRERGKTS